MNTAEWYASLNKPYWSPPTEIFGIIWGILYPIIFISFGYVFYKIYKGEYPKKLAYPFALNLFFNLIFSPIQLGTRNFYLASIDILLVVITLIWAIYEVRKHSKTIAVLQLPYLVWAIIATCLQLSITYLNL